MLGSFAFFLVMSLLFQSSNQFEAVGINFLSACSTYTELTILIVYGNNLPFNVGCLLPVGQQICLSLSHKYGDEICGLFYISQVNCSIARSTSTLHRHIRPNQ